MLSSPSGVPSLSSALRSGGVKPCAAASLPSPVVPPLVSPPPLLLPHATSASMAAAETATSRRVPVIWWSLPGRPCPAHGPHVLAGDLDGPRGLRCCRSVPS